MILRDIQTYFHSYQRASLSELSLHFRTDMEALRPMLQLLQRKGRVKLIESKKCESCANCSSLSLEVYERID